MTTKLLSRKGRNDRNGSRPALLIVVTDSVVVKMVQYFVSFNDKRKALH